MRSASASTHLAGRGATISDTGTERRRAIHDALVRLADGDRSAFDTLIDELWPIILSFSERGVGKSADAEDVAQEVFYRICARIADFDRTRDGLSWAFGIASYEILTHRKRLQRRREVSDADALENHLDATASPEGALLEQELSRALEEVMGGLTAEDREALGLGTRGVADGPASPKARKRKQRILLRLRDLFRSIYADT
ncbi:MAG TPA: sigma-70 family RNA polymerase sigma factor [Polyangiaceae bacterium]|nr:sigma-70 family RNA polymerase sigma factor [Polyangiaceae bacterium]